MSEDESTSRPPNSLAALSGLTRSGPAPSAADSIEGAAKGDDSGLIDLRAMSQPEPEPVVPAAAAAPVMPAEQPAPVSLSNTAPAAPSSKSNVAVASTAPANVTAAVPPSSTTATAASAPAAAAAAPRAQEKKGGGTVIWLALGGVAAAAAAAFFFVGPGAKKDEASTATAPAAAQNAEKKADEKVAVAEKPAATVEPQASAAAPVEEPAAAPTIAPKPGSAPPTGGGTKALAAAPDPKAGAAAKPTASAAPTATEAPKSAGTGSLDEVLGIGKDQPVKKADPTDNLPDKPDSMDVRSAINSKLSAANACVKGLEGPSNASVTFGPSGSVSGVVITSGPAKGTGAESCVKNAFSSAKVPPSKKGASGSATLMP